MPPEISEEELKELKTAKEERENLKKEHETLKKELEGIKAKPEDDKKKKEEETSLLEKARKDKEADQQKKNEMRDIESALSFNAGLADFLKTHADILPSEVSDVVKKADKENYDSKLDKATALKTAIVESFFSVQGNVDALTKAQKTALEDYLKLTVKGKQEKAAFVYENIFEPAIETVKKVKKAEELGKARAGFSSGSSVENAYKDRLMKSSQKTYLGKEG